MNHNHHPRNYGGNPAAMAQDTAKMLRIGDTASFSDEYAFQVEKERPASSIATAEATLIAAMDLACRVQVAIDRLMGGSTLTGGGLAGNGASGVEKEPAVLARLRTLAIATDDAIGRAGAALDRLEIELK